MAYEEIASLSQPKASSV